MRLTIKFITVALLLSGWSATAALPYKSERGVQKTISETVGREPFSGSIAGVFAVRMNGDTIVDVNSRLRMVPASNMKLITTGLALNELGGDFRFETSIAYTGAIVNGVLKGDLYIIGGGDPTTGSKSHYAEPLESLFAKWAAFLKESGIKSIEGRVIGDPRFFPAGTAQNAGWTYDDLGTNYGSGSTGLNFFENGQNFIVAAGPYAGSRPSVRISYPESPWLECINSAVTGEARSANTLFYVNSDFGPHAEIRGSFPADRKGGYLFEGSNRFGAFTCAYYFWKYLKNKGISTDGYGDVSPAGLIRMVPGLSDTGIVAASDADLHVIGTTYSPTLAQIAADTNGDSNNFYAETLFKMMSLKRRGSVEYDVCQRVADEILSSVGIRNGKQVQIFDGSGLSRKNYVSPSFFVRFLRAMAMTPEYENYFNSLPVPGGEGTLKGRFPKASQSFKSRIHMKSGSMNGVRGYSGYILSEDGNPENTIVFSIIFNNLTSSSWAVSPAIDHLIELIAAEN